MRWLDGYVTKCDSNKKRLAGFIKVYVPLVTKFIDDGSLEVRNQAMQVLGSLLRVKGDSDPILNKLMAAIPDNRMQRIVTLAKPAQKTIMTMKSLSVPKIGKLTVDRLVLAACGAGLNDSLGISDKSVDFGGKSVAKFGDIGNLSILNSGNDFGKKSSLKLSDNILSGLDAGNCGNNMMLLESLEGMSVGEMEGHVSVRGNNDCDVGSTPGGGSARNLGASGMTPEEAEQILRGESKGFHLPLEQLKSQNYKDKSEALGTMTALIESDNFRQNLARPVLLILKKRTKDFKDANIHIVKAIFALLEEISKKIDPLGLGLMISYLVEKLSEKNLVDKIYNILCNCTKTLPARLVVDSFIEGLKNRQLNPRASVESISIIEKFLKTHRDNLNLKNIIVYGKIALMNSNQQPRLVAVNLFKNLQEVMGPELLRTKISDFPPNTLKNLDTELKIAAQHLNPGKYTTQALS
jgi:hypothetical protein